MNWLTGKPIMRRPVILKVVYRFNEELKARLVADHALDLASPASQFPAGYHAVINDDAQVEVRADSDYPDIDWADETTYPPNLAVPEMPVASSFGTNAPAGTPAAFIGKTFDMEMDGMTTLANAVETLRQTTLDFLRFAQSSINKVHSVHAPYLRQRFERIAMNVLCSQAVRLFPYVLPGRHHARHYGRVRTTRAEFSKRYFYWGNGPTYNGCPAIHFPPGRPAWSTAQYVFLQRCWRVRRRKWGKDGKLHGNAKPFNQIKVKVPPLKGHNIPMGGDMYGRPQIGRRMARKMGRTLAAQIQSCFTKPLVKTLLIREARIKSMMTKTNVLRNVVRGGDLFGQMQDEFQDFFKEQMIHDICDSVAKNLTRLGTRKMNYYKRQLINSIGDPVIDYGMTVAVKVARRLDPNLKWTFFFDKNNPFDKLLFQARGNAKYPDGMSDTMKARFESVTAR